MARSLSVLDRVRIASPCNVPWSTMTGDDHVRHCSQCNLNVYNLSEMTRADAEKLIVSHEGRLCAGYRQRQDGTILTRDCPVGLSIVRQKLAKTLGAVAAAFAFVAGGLHALARGGQNGEDFRLQYFQPFAALINYLSPPTPPMWLGTMASIAPEQTQLSNFKMPDFHSD